MFVVEIIWCCLLLSWSINQSTSQSLDAVYLSNHLTILTNDVLGVQDMQDILNNKDYYTVPMEDGEDLIVTLKDSLQYKYQNAISVVEALVETVEQSFQTEMHTWPQCCHVSDQGLVEDPRFKQKTDFTQICYRLSGTATSDPYILSENTFDDMTQIRNQYPNVLWLYYGGEEGALHQYPTTVVPDCDSYDPRYRPWYIEAATPMPKDVVIVIDRSGSMATSHNGRTLMNIAKEAAITVLKSMNPNDRVGFVAFSDEASTPEGGCHSERLAEASALNTFDLEDEINNISPSGNTYYSNALDAAFDLIKQSPFPGNQTRNQIILFLTDGLPSDDSTAIMETLLRRSEAAMFRVALLTFGFGEDIDQNTEILSDIALQNYEKYNLTPNFMVGERIIGKYTYVNDPDKLRASMATYYNFISDAGTSGDIVFPVPYLDAFGAGLVSSILKPVRIDGELKGVVGTDLPVAEMFEDVTYFKQGEYSYAFLFDSKDSAQGRTLRHPLLPLPQAVTNDYSIYVHITTLERAPEFEEYVYKDAISGGEGQRTFVADKIIARGDTFAEGVNVVSVSTTYHWRQIEETTLIVVLAIVEEDDEAQLAQQQVLGDPFVYHRIDLWTPSGVTTCNHIGNYAVGSSSVVFLTADAFVAPTTYLEEEETSDLVQAYTDYMNGNDGSRQNAFQSGIRDEVVVTHFTDDTWLQDANNDQVVMRYIGTSKGVLRSYPGFKMNKNRDYTVEQWFAQAMRDKDLLVITIPSANLFDASSSPMVTLSKAITYRASSKVFGVMGMDMTVDFFYYQMTELYPECQQNYNCFVMDRSGYLITHQDLLSGSSENSQRRHVVEKEKLLSQDLIDNGIMVRKACLNYQDIKRQYYYEVVDIEGGVTDKLASLGCLQYRLEFIPNTNAVLVIISAQLNCNYNCYCSPANCVSEEPYTCECPCAEDEESFDYCDFEYDVDENSSPSCAPPLYVPPSDDDMPSTDGLQPCIETDCSSKSPSSCSSSAVCEMCDSECKDTQENCEQPSTTVSPSATSSVTKILGIVIAAVVISVVLLIVSFFIVKQRRANRRNVNANLPNNSHTQQKVVNDDLLVYHTSIPNTEYALPN